MIAKRVVEGDLDDGQRCFGPCFCGGLDAGAQQQIIRAVVECDAEFAMKVTLDAGPSAYSELAVLPDGTVLCLWETKSDIQCVRFNLEWITAP